MTDKHDNNTGGGAGRTPDLSRRLAMRVNLAFMATDIAYGSLADMREAMQEEGVRTTFAIRNAVNTIMRASRQLMREVRLDQFDDSLAATFGDASDKAWMLTLMTLDRFGHSSEAMFKAWCWMKAHPSRLGIPLPEWADSVFAPTGEEGKQEKPPHDER